MTIHFITDRGDVHLRLDQILVRRVNEVSRMSRTRAQAWIADGLVLVGNAAASRASAKVREGTAIQVELPASTTLRQAPRAEELPLDVLYEDDAILAVNKPAGVVVHPSFRNASGTVINAVLWRYRDRPEVRPGLVSRLDKDTSGVLLIALSPEIHARVQRDARAGRMVKEYTAVVLGVPRPSNGTITLALGRDPADRRRVVVAVDGAASETRYRVVAQGHTCALVSCELITGRTHQIRVHLSASGWPIAGDVVYGGSTGEIGRQALHASSVTLIHPVTGTPLQITAGLPEDLRGFARLHGLDGAY